MQKQPARSPKIYNVSMPLAATEYNFKIPQGTVLMAIKLRDATQPLQYSYEAGESGTTYRTIAAGTDYYEPSAGNVVFDDQTIYFQSPAASMVAEIICWRRL